MGPWDLLLVAVVLVLGLVGVLIPGVPGGWLTWAAILWWALQDPKGLTWAVFLGSTAVLLIAQGIRWQLRPRRLREGVLTPRLAVSAGVGSLVGFCVLPVLGVPFGFMGGIYVAERVRLGSHGDARAATRAAMRSGGWSVLTELYACLLVTAAWLGALAWG